MSRLVVKNLPKNVTKELVQETFSQKGIVTDVQLKYTKDGKFRHFGFVGFANNGDAEAAMQYFDNTFINATKIRVELCAELGDPNKPKAWREFNKEVREKIKTRALLKDQPEEPEKPVPKPVEQNVPGKPKVNKVIAEALKKYGKDKLFKEFMSVHAGGNTSIWDNDLLAAEQEVNEKKNTKKEKSKHEESKPTTDTKEEEEIELPEEQNKVAGEKISDLEYMKRITVKDSTETKVETKHKNKSQNIVEDVAGTNTATISDPDAGSVEGDVADSKTDFQGSHRIKMPKQKKEYKEMFTVKITGLVYKIKKSELKKFFHPLKLASARVPPKIPGIAYVGFKTEREMNEALAKNRSFCGGKRVSIHISKKKDAPKDEIIPKWHAQEESLKNEEDVSESGRIFVRNLSYATTEEDLEELFNRFGDTTEISMPINRTSKLSKGFAHVSYLFPEHAVKAFKTLDGTVYKGRMLHLLRGKPKPSLEEAMMEDGLSYSAKKDLKKKMQSGSSHNWNSLFLGQNAVVDVMAATYNTTKEHVLDGQGNESLAVRLALGETQIVTETKEFLTKHQVKLDAFNQAPKVRSKRVILVKNLPAKTTEKELMELFSPHGDLTRIVLPPSGITGIIEFAEPFEARAAFTKLAYTKFKDLPLYLEWAPLDTFTEDPKPINEAENGSTEEKNAVTPDVGIASNTEAEDKNEPPEPETTLYVKNINFKTTEEELLEHFKQCGTVHSVSITYRKSTTNPSEKLSKGYGFVRYKKYACSTLALQTLQNKDLQGHNLELTRSHRTVATDVVSERKKTVIGQQTGSKILVRNIPFQANYQEIKDLFKPFGELKAIRLPKKMVGSGKHRGFVFVEYESKSDAKRALEALCQSTHLYGRRLVLEWAAKDDDVNDLRKRTADQFFAAPTATKSMRPSNMIVDKEEMDSYE